MESKGWFLYGTDKSGKLVLDLRENFNKCMEPHYIHEIPVTIEHVHNSEKSLNNHSKAWAEILQIGADAGLGQSDRVKGHLL